MAESTTQLTNHGEKGEGVKSITLLNGTELVCYPSVPFQETTEEGELSLDRSGRYFVISRKSVPKLTSEEEELQRHNKEIVDIFTENAFYLFQNADRIFQDSRMFLANIPVENHLAYFGTSPFYRPTLGVYLEWWLNGPFGLREDDEGNPALLYHIAGSPLSGANECGYVLPDGSCKTAPVGNFRYVWQNFQELNNRYNCAKKTCDAYSLQQVIDILKAADEGDESKLSLQLNIEEDKYKTLVQEFISLRNRYDELKKNHYTKCMEFNKEALHKVHSGFQNMYYIANDELDILKDQRKDLKNGLDAGVYDQKEYQELLRPLQDREKEIRHNLEQFLIDNVQPLIENSGLEKKEVLDYVLDV